MKTTQVAALFSLFTGVLISGNCYKRDLPAEAVDVTRYTTNLTQMAAKASWSGRWDEKSKLWVDASFEHLGGTEALIHNLLPAYVPVFAGDCAHSAGYSFPQVGFEVAEITNRLRTNEEQGGKRNNIVLVGEPGIDVDARVQALAWQISKKCPGIPEAWQMREVISIDLGALRKESASKNMSAAAYMRVLRKILEEWGHNAIYYLNDFSEIAESGPRRAEPSAQVDVETVLKLFLENDANVIIEATSAQYGQYIRGREMRANAPKITLEPLSSELLMPAIAALALVEGKTTGVRFEPTVVEKIVRLSRAFLPSNGALSQASAILDEVVQSALAESKQADDDMVFDAMVLLHPSLQRRALVESDALHPDTTLSDIDSNVARPDYYIDQARRELSAEAMKKAIGRDLEGLYKLIGNITFEMAGITGITVGNLAKGLVELNNQLTAVKNAITDEKLYVVEDIAPLLADLHKLLTIVKSKLKGDHDLLNGPIADGLVAVGRSLEIVKGAVDSQAEFLVHKVHPTIAAVSRLIEDADDKLDGASANLNSVASYIDKINKRFDKDGNVRVALDGLSNVIDIVLMKELVLLKARFQSHGDFAKSIEQLKALADATKDGELKADIAKLEKGGSVQEKLTEINVVIETKVVKKLGEVLDLFQNGDTSISGQVDTLKEAASQLPELLAPLLERLRLDSQGKLAGSIAYARSELLNVLDVEILSALLDTKKMLNEGEKNFAGQVALLKKASELTVGTLDPALEMLSVGSDGNLTGSIANAKAAVNELLLTKVLNVLADTMAKLNNGDKNIVGQVALLKRASSMTPGLLDSSLEMLRVDRNGNLVGSIVEAKEDLRKLLSTSILNVLVGTKIKLSAGNKNIAEQVMALKNAADATPGLFDQTLEMLNIDDSGQLIGSIADAKAVVNNLLLIGVLNVLTDAVKKLSVGDRNIVAEVDSLKRAADLTPGMFDVSLRMLNVDRDGNLIGSIVEAKAELNELLSTGILKVLQQTLDKLNEGDRRIFAQVTALRKAAELLPHALEGILSQLNVDAEGNLIGAISNAVSALQADILELQKARHQAQKDLEKATNGPVSKCALADDVCTQFNTGMGGYLPSVPSELSHRHSGADACKAREVAGVLVCQVKKGFSAYCARNDSPDPCASRAEVTHCEEMEGCSWP